MKYSRQRVAPVLLAFALGSTGLHAQQQAPGTLPGGLVRNQSSPLALAYVRPGTNWGKYKTIELRTLAVPAKVRNAAPPGQTPEFGESYILSDSDVTNLQQYFAQSFHNILGNAGFTFVATPQANTLIIIPQVDKIELSAPIQDTRMSYAGPGFTLSQGGGAMAVSAVLADGATGVVIAEVADRQYGSSTWGLNNSVSNYAEAREAFDQWARDLRDKLQSN
jgi:hypothetical protein